ncbi:MAG: hypothetical protein ACTSRU_18080 [Candidatus Hodarchaeales archaeon]
MGFEVYTTISAPFRMGGTKDYIKTEIEEYQRVEIGAGYFGLLFQNPSTKGWHMALEDCGALIGSKQSRAKLIAMVKKDVSGGTPEIFESQIERGKKEMLRSTFIKRDEWFGHFRKDNK